MTTPATILWTGSCLVKCFTWDALISLTDLATHTLNSLNLISVVTDKNLTVSISDSYLCLLGSSQTVLHLHSFNYTDLLTLRNLHTFTHTETLDSV